MERTIYDIMTDDPAKITEFKNACDEMLKTQYILVQGRISAILKTIATSKILYNFFDRILLNFDYKETAKSCTLVSEMKIKLPTNPQEIAAFVFCVLLDIDKQNIELIDFLQFFGGNDLNQSYQNFLKEFIAPFRDSVLQTLKEEQQKQQEKQQMAEKENERKQMELNFERYMSTFKTRIKSDVSLTPATKDDLILLCEKFADAVRNDDYKMSSNLYAKLVKKLYSHKPALAKEFEKFEIDTL